MKRWRAIYALGLLFATGCGQSGPDIPPTIVGQRTVTVSADVPFIDMEDGTKFPVDGVQTGQSMQIKLTRYRHGDGKISVDVDTVTDAELKKP